MQKETKTFPCQTLGCEGKAEVIVGEPGAAIDCRSCHNPIAIWNDHKQEWTAWDEYMMNTSGPPGAFQDEDASSDH